MAKKDTVIVRAKLETVNTDPTQYKPYAPTLSFENVYVDIPIPAENASEEKGVIVLDANGLAITMDVIATAIDAMNTKRTLSKQNPHNNYRPY